MEPKKLAAAVPVSVVLKADGCLSGAVPVDQWTMKVPLPDGELTVHLHEGVSGWFGYCTCKTFAENLEKAQGTPVTPCEHLCEFRRIRDRGLPH